MSLRALRYHEQRLLRRVDFVNWKTDDSLRENAILRRYHIQHRWHLQAYNRIVGAVRKLISRIKRLPADDPVRIDITEQLVRRLYSLGIITRDSNSTLAEAERITASAIARRRLAIVLVRQRMANSPKDAVKIIETGNVRVGTDTITDPAFIVTRSMADYVKWTDKSAIKTKIGAFRDELDDFDMLRP